jgi:pimeloyl-ACP methyl ester carboxylesterase
MTMGTVVVRARYARRGIGCDLALRGHEAVSEPSRATAGDPERFRLAVTDAELEDLRARLCGARWPERETVDDWSQGMPLAFLQRLCRYWADGYDWRATEARLDALGQFRIDIDGLGIHFLHVRSPHARALPLVMTHGWPGSIVEFLDVLGPLTDPTAHGGAPSDAFHVVCPSLPGFGFSDKPGRPGWGIERIAGVWIELMARLGYGRYGAQGTDWGTSISALVGQRDPEHVVGIHLMPPLASPDPSTVDDLTDRERAALADLERAAEWESGYSIEHATKPQTIGYALVDSPVALAAWVLEKFWSWTDHDGDLERVLTRDQLLDNLMCYWLPRTGASSARLYWESIRRVNGWIAGGVTDPIDVPTGCSIFPRELQRPSRRWAERRFTDIRYWSEPAHGGHFPAFEQPELFVDEVRSFFRHVR